jgi:catechol 2,3-dioxygenase-like lactoylglutathione lyase family enzyme
MKPACAATIFHVSNVESSVKYYTEVLGFTVDFRYNDLTGLEYDAVLIYLSGPAQDVKKAIGEGSVYIFCDEVDQYFEDISLKGAITEIIPGDRPYGMRDFAIKDPDGNIISFGRSIEG